MRSNAGAVVLPSVCADSMIRSNVLGSARSPYTTTALVFISRGSTCSASIGLNVPL